MSTLPTSDGDSGAGPAADRPPRAPRWVKLAGIIVIALALLFVIAQLAGIGGHHGPGRHMPKAEPSEQAGQKEFGALAPSPADDHASRRNRG